MTKHVVLGAGPVGRATVDALASRGIEALVVTRSGTAVPGTKAATANVLDTDALARVIAGADVVYQASQPEYHR